MQPNLLSVRKIWDSPPLSAYFPDLIRYNELWFCVLRESNEHAKGKDGTLRLLTSKDGDVWETAATFQQEGIDLRDPKLSITPDGRLMLLAGGTIYREKKYVTRQSRVAFSTDGVVWSSFQLILEPHEWLWRITWHDGKAYGVSYTHKNPHKLKQKWFVTLFQSPDGVNFSKVVTWPLAHYPNETTLRFLDTGEMVALLRRERRRRTPALIGLSKPPYKRWKWKSSGVYFGGPNFLILDNGSMWAGGRILLRTPYGIFEKTVLAVMTLESLTPVLVLPSGVDSSYPGMAMHEGILWMTYYSGHEGNGAIFLAQIKV